VSAQFLPLEARPESTSDWVLASIREAITARTLAPGSVVTEAQLAKDLGVSKTPVREALLRLREVGLVQPMPVRGMKIIESTRDTMMQSYEFRGFLEGGIAKFAAQRATDEQITTMEAAAAESLRFANKHDADGFRRSDRNFHSTTWAASGNAEMERIADNAYSLSSALRAIHALSNRDSIKCAEQHVDIVRAIREGDGERAAELATAHVHDVLQYSLTSLT
jgi:DNA-binding GntR family transcriptional regulator